MATFSLDEDQRQIQETMGRFAAGVMRPMARDCDERRAIPADFLAAVWELGITTGVIPEEYGGYGGARSVLNNVIMTEELAWGDLSLALAALTPNSFVLPLVEMGTEEQKQRLLPLFCGPDFTVGTLALMEQRVDFHATDIRTTAHREGPDEYVLNGEKCLVPFADDARYLLVIAAGDEGREAFIVERDAPGLTIASRERLMGLGGLPLYRVQLEECIVPEENRLGGEEGVDYERLVSLCRVGLSAAAAGVSRAVQEYCVEYAKERQAFGAPLVSRQAIAFMIADMAIETDGSRLLGWKAAWSADQEGSCARLASLAKAYSAEQAFRIADAGVSILGGHGLIREHPVELWFRNTRAFAMLEGMAMV